MAGCLKRANKRLMHRIKQHLYSITSSARATNAAEPCRGADELFSQAAKAGAIGNARKAA